MKINVESRTDVNVSRFTETVPAELNNVEGGFLGRAIVGAHVAVGTAVWNLSGDIADGIEDMVLEAADTVRDFGNSALKCDCKC
jgi:hypothetical protein